MNNKWQTHTTEKLLLADVQLKEWDAQLKVHGDSLSQSIQASFKQASMLLISLGWESLLNELAEYHQQKTSYLVNLQQLKTLLGEDIPEVAYLSEAVINPESWLYDLTHFNKLLRQPQSRKVEYAETLAQDALIAVSDSLEPIDSINNLKRIHREFKAYLKELRVRMSEW